MRIWIRNTVFSLQIADLWFADWDTKGNLRICDLRNEPKNLRICGLRANKTNFACPPRNEVDSSFEN